MRNVSVAGGRNIYHQPNFLADTVSNFMLLWQDWAKFRALHILVGALDDNFSSVSLVARGLGMLSSCPYRRMRGDVCSTT